MTEYIADILTKNMITDGLIEEHEKSIYYYSIQVLIERIIGFSRGIIRMCGGVAAPGGTPNPCSA